MKNLLLLLSLIFMSSCCDCFKSKEIALKNLHNELSTLQISQKAWPTSFQQFSQSDVINKQPLQLLNQWGLWHEPQFSTQPNGDLLITAKEYFSPNAELHIKKLRFRVEPSQ